MKRQVSISLIALLFLGLFSVYPSFITPVQAQVPSSEKKITVLSPRGQPPAIQLKQMAPRLLRYQRTMLNRGCCTARPSKSDGMISSLPSSAMTWRCADDR